ncbi:MAG: hypothetical protein JW759_04720 [Candidatus Coatesbacteria bacterium]|nr:hypothetical protein [Candidatus Coatesbacteria bacterium]
MTPHRACFYMDSGKCVESGVLRAVKWLEELRQRDPTKTNALVVVHKHRNLDGGITSALGARLVNRLARYKWVILDSGIRVNLMTDRGGVLHWDGPAVVFWPAGQKRGERLLKQVENVMGGPQPRARGVTDLLVVTDVPKEVGWPEWLHRWISENEATELTIDRRS